MNAWHFDFSTIASKSAIVEELPLVQADESSFVPLLHNQEAPEPPESDLDRWIKKIRRETDLDALLRLLDEFRTYEWTDVERSRMSKTYIGRIDQLLK